MWQIQKHPHYTFLIKPKLCSEDENLAIEKVSNRKATQPHEIGAPLQGRLTQILVEEGGEVSRNQPLFVIEAMKMESTITANVEGTIKTIHLQAGQMVEQDDLIMEFEA